ncbi:MAG: sugar 3,4-ketoisomerase [Gammaproteobacteria bacterium WSBS_2016_MAG_OTU1]
MIPQFIDFRIIGDARGSLLVAESGDNIPFTIARVYYVYDMPPDARRGFHAHHTLQQIAVCLRGTCDFLLDDGKSKVECRLDSPAKGLYIGKMIWHEFYNASPDCLLAVFADAKYDEGDYIREYESFLTAVG